MHIIGTHFQYALRKAWAEKKVSLIRLLQFVGITVILGVAFNSAFQTPDFEKVGIGYVSEDLGEGGATYLEQLSGTAAFQDVAEFTEVESSAAGRSLVQDEELGALLVLGENFTADLDTDGGQATVEVYSEQYSGINYIVVSSVVDGFNNGANASWAIQSLGEQLDASGQSTAIEQQSIDDVREMTGIIYYSVGMLLFLLLFGAEYGSFGISQEYLGAMQSRTHLAPQKTWQMIVGKLSAYSLVTFVQGALFMLITGLALGVPWGDNLPLALLVVFVFGAFAISLGMAIMTVTRDMQKTTTIIQVVLIGFTFLGGGFIAIDLFGAEQISPNFYAREALFAAVFGDGLDVAWRNIGILAALIAGLTGISAIAASKRRTA
ncbi:ABC transporter permease [Cryobacterium sp. 1639]|uniref:ABC transporter permease n=1 Tax=Cryobacterium inferilacus TaxID=2866629 RepID=UPI001C73D348|nr:ABC transporter permease [Cryobacterium sp. 1639]MBX0301899.1 ABC transporter permease [Cryobacterium sp. 1639]